MWKNIFGVFYVWAKNIKSESKRKMQKWQVFHIMGQGGAKLKKGGAKSRTDSGPAQASHLQPPALFEQTKTHVS